MVFSRNFQDFITLKEMYFPSLSLIKKKVDVRVSRKYAQLRSSKQMQLRCIRPAQKKALRGANPGIPPREHRRLLIITPNILW